MTNWIWPSNGPITQGFSPTHPGIDIGVPVSTSVLAAAPGKIVKEGIWGTGGKTIQIDHGNGLVSQYMHLSEYDQSLGAQVGQGQRIGLSGNSGITTGPHLHFEINLHGVPVNPESYLIGAGGASISGATPLEIAKAQQNADAAAMAHAGFPDPFGILGKIGSWVTGTSTVAASPVVAVATGADYLAKAGGFLTKSENWKRIGLGTIGALLLIIAAIELLSKNSTVSTIAKVA